MSKKKNEPVKYIVFSVSGGIGKNILATSIVKALKIKHPDRKIIILSTYMDVWLFNPNVYRVYSFDKALYFYDEYIKDKDTLIFAQDPYLHQNYINKTSHVLTVWGEICGVDPQFDRKPELFFNQREMEHARNNYAQGEYYVIQTHGGASTDIKHSWYRDMPMEDAQKIINQVNAAGKRLIHVRRDDQPEFSGVQKFQGSMRQTWLLLLFSSGAFLIDSMMQHAAAALSKKSTVLWIGNKPQQLGYPTHHNVIANIDVDASQNPFGVLSSHAIVGINEECPFTPTQTSLFKVDEIVESVLQ